MKTIITFLLVTCSLYAQSDSVEQDQIRKLYLIPFPNFQDSKANGKDKENGTGRVLSINAIPYADSANTSLTKFKRRSVPADALLINKPLNVILKGYNFTNVKRITVSLEGFEYTYSKDISTILASAKNGQKSQNKSGKDSIDSLLNISHPEDYFSTVISVIKKIKNVDINDVYVIENYKSLLRTWSESYIGQLSAEESALLSEILSWKPETVLLTPIPVSVPEADEITVKIEVETEGTNDKISHKIGTYNGAGGFTIGVGGMLYMTGLKNREVFINSIPTDDPEVDQKFAKVNGGDDKTFGIGINAEIAYRTGYLLRPNFNVGFFVPFDEEIRPYLAVGPGISINAKNVSLNISYGLAYGQVDSIQKRYQGVDLATLSPDLTINDITEKVWRQSQYVGLGLRYNFGDGED